MTTKENNRQFASDNWSGICPEVIEEVIFFNKDVAGEFAYRCKQAGQLVSKMRFITAPWSRMLADGTLLRNATNANTRTKELNDRLSSMPQGWVLI